MIRTTPFHERTSALNETGLWEHWSNHLAADRYQMSEKFEYFAIRNSAGLFDSSPLYKYRIHGPDAERFLAGVLARDIRTCRPGHAQYTVWCDDRGFVVEDGVILRHGPDEFLLTAAEPNLAYFEELVGRLDVGIEEVSDDWAVLAVQGPRSRDLLGVARARRRRAALLRARRDEDRQGPGPRSRGPATPATSATRSGSRPRDALTVWDAVWAASRGRGVVPIGMTALYMARIEAGLVLLDVDFHSSRFAWTDADRTTPDRARPRLDAPRPGDRRPRVHRARRDPARAGRQDVALEAHRARRRLARLRPDLRRGRAHPAQGPHADPGRVLHLRRRPATSSATPRARCTRRCSSATSPSPGCPLDRLAPGSRVKLELAVNHRYEYFDAHVARTPLFNPERRTA